MDIKATFAPEVSIHLTDDLNGFVYTVKRSGFLTECEEVAVAVEPDAPEIGTHGAVSELVRIRNRRRPRYL